MPMRPAYDCITRVGGGRPSFDSTRIDASGRKLVGTNAGTKGSARAGRDSRKRRGMNSGYYVLAFVVLAIVLIVLVVAYRKMPRD